MNKSIRQILSAVLLVASLSAKGQLINPETDTVQWDYSAIENKVLSEMVSQGGSFISYGANGFKWIQNGVDREYSFENKSVKGTWSDAGQDGELIYESVCKEESGVIRFYRDKRKITLILDFVQPDKRTPHLVFEINSYAKMR